MKRCAVPACDARARANRVCPAHEHARPWCHCPQCWEAMALIAERARACRSSLYDQGRVPAPAMPRGYRPDEVAEAEARDDAEARLLLAMNGEGVLYAAGAEL